MCSHRACGNFSSALSHCGGDNGTEDYVYCLFAYAVLDEVDYPQGVVDRDVKDDIIVREEGGILVEGGFRWSTWLGYYYCLDLI